MIIYVIFFTVLILGALNSTGKRNSKDFLLLIMIFLWLIIGLRAPSVGSDTLGYTKDFEHYSRMSFSEMLNFASTCKEPLYVIITWIPSIWFSHYTSFLLLWALFPVCSLYKIFKTQLNGSMDYMIAMLLFFMLGFYSFYVAGIRQTAAISLVSYAGLKYLRPSVFTTLKTLRRGNIYKFTIFMGLAYMIHNSSLLFLLAIPSLFLKARWWYLPVAFGMFFLGKFVNLGQISVVSEFFFEDRFGGYAKSEVTLSTSAFIMQMILFSICAIKRKKLIKCDKMNSFLFNMMFLGIFFQALAGTLAEMFRVSFYFSFFAIILVPKAMNAYGSYNRNILYTSFVIASFVYLFILSGNALLEYRSILIA